MPPPITSSTKRVLELDIAKGMLVVIMLIYHAASVAIHTEDSLLPFMKATSFLHYVFVFLTGYICGWLYMPKTKHSPRGVGKTVNARIRLRAIKIFLIFLGSNIALYMIGLQNINELSKFYQSPNAIIGSLTDGISGSLFSFEVLYYIAYFLFFASFFVGTNSKGKIGCIRWSVTAALVLLSTVSTVGLYLAFGTIGTLIGYLSSQGGLSRIWAVIKKYNWAIIGFFAFNLIFHNEVRKAITSTLPLGHFIAYALDCTLWLISLVLITVKVNIPSLTSLIVKLGGYTLLAYMAQMFFVRVGYNLFTSLGFSQYSYYLANFSFSLCLLLLLIYAVDIIRQKSNKLDSLYRMVFS